MYYGYYQVIHSSQQGKYRTETDVHKKWQKKKRTLFSFPSSSEVLWHNIDHHWLIIIVIIFFCVREKKKWRQKPMMMAGLLAQFFSYVHSTDLFIFLLAFVFPSLFCSVYLWLGEWVEKARHTFFLFWWSPWLSHSTAEFTLLVSGDVCVFMGIKGQTGDNRGCRARRSIL